MAMIDLNASPPRRLITDLNATPPCTPNIVVNLVSDDNSPTDQEVEGVIQGVVDSVIQQNNDQGSSAEEVDQIIEPALGMEFPSGAEFAMFCFDYAYKKGFSMFSRTTILKPEFKALGVNRNGVKDKEPQFHMMDRIRLSCTKGGKKTTAGSTVTGCKVFVEARFNPSKQVMEIRGVKLDHNHLLVDPSLSRMIPNYRCVDETAYDQMVKNHKAGVSLKKNFNTFVTANNGEDNMPFDEDDLRNTIKIYKRATWLSGDAVALEEYFEKMKKDNPNFFYAIQRDKDNVIRNAFWADARTIAAFQDFDDVTTYDTTHLCNRYRFPFSAFIGVNHHGQSIIFAAALTAHEDRDTFCWIFEKFVECMGHPPKGILTDQDKAIAYAVNKVFPGVPHRLCIWHILENAGRTMGSLSRWSEIREELQGIVHDTLTPEEFDDAWAVMVQKFKLGTQTWLRETYRIRERWAPGYWKSTFWAGMSSTQRSEGMNRYFKTYFSANIGLREFIERYRHALVGKVEDERKMDFDSKHKPLKCDKSILVESVFHKAYTNAKFREVRDEVLGLKHTNVVKTGSEGNTSIYAATQKITEPVWRVRKRTFVVKIDKEAGLFSCSCKMFEFRGILCRHIIRGMEVEDVESIPERYILDRWRKDVVRSYEAVKVEYCDPDVLLRVKLVREVEQKGNYLCKLALHSDETLQIFNTAAEKIRESLEASIGITRTHAAGKDWFDESATVVYGRRRVRPKHKNLRHLQKSAKPPAEDAPKDPPNRAGAGRPQKNRPKHPSEFKRRGVSARKERSRREHEAALLEEGYTEDESDGDDEFNRRGGNHGGGKTRSKRRRVGTDTQEQSSEANGNDSNESGYFFNENTNGRYTMMADEGQTLSRRNFSSSIDGAGHMSRRHNRGGVTIQEPSSQAASDSSNYLNDRSYGKRPMYADDGLTRFGRNFVSSPSVIPAASQMRRPPPSPTFPSPSLPSPTPGSNDHSPAAWERRMLPPLSPKFPSRSLPSTTPAHNTSSNWSNFVRRRNLEQAVNLSED